MHLRYARACTGALLLLAACFPPRSLSAQTPNFAGKWIVDWPLTDAANAKLGGPGEPHGASQRVSMTQDAKEVTQQTDSHPVQHFKLDGSDSVNVREGGRTMVSNATIRSGRLTIVNHGQRGNATLVYTVADDTLTEVITIPAPDGPGTITTALVYRRIPARKP